MKIKYPFRWLHAVMAVLGIAVCGSLLSAQSGHPPGIMFLPLAVAAWVAIHLFLGLAQAFATRGIQRLQEQGRDNEGWPIALVLIVFVFGTFFLYQLAGVVSWLMSNESLGTRRVIFPFFALVAFAGFCGILLRRSWGRLVTAMACFLISIYFVDRAIPHVFLAKNLSPGLQLIVLVRITAFALLGAYLLRSRRVKSFFV